MIIKSPIELKFYEVNKKLNKRTKSNSISYIILVFLSSLIILAYGFIYFIVYKEPDFIFQSYLNILMYLVLALDLGLIALKFDQNNTITPQKIIPYPLTIWQKLRIQLLLFTTDYKVLIYFSAIVITVIIFISESLYFSAISSVLIWILLYANICIWITILFQLLNDFLEERKKNISQSIFLVLAIVLIVINKFDAFGMLNYLPFINSLGIQSLVFSINDVTELLESVGFLAFSLLLGVFFYPISNKMV